MARGSAYAKARCDLCGKPIAVSYMVGHRRKMHGIRGGRTGRLRRTAEEMSLTTDKAVAQAKRQMLMAQAQADEVASHALVNSHRNEFHPPSKEQTMTITVLPFFVGQLPDGRRFMGELID